MLKQVIISTWGNRIEDQYTGNGRASDTLQTRDMSANLIYPKHIKKGRGNEIRKSIVKP